ncbi:MAG: efflux RND transporter periplasmic adaptor subunit [Synechococcales cyanobacterium CRU_2_2]|nr:efflux RND transporter periplasmic adaptor subunit [Synechococcales cyanobacterium CRU_2_2]
MTSQTNSAFYDFGLISKPPDSGLSKASNRSKTDVEATVTDEYSAGAPLVVQESEGEGEWRVEDGDRAVPRSLSSWKQFWWILPILGTLLAVGSLSYVRIRDKNAEAPAVVEAAPLTVRTVAAEQGAIQAWVSSEGTVQAVRFKHLAFDVDGDITYVADKEGRTLREGDRVTQGELLAQVDDRNLQAEVNQAEAAVNEARQQRGVAAASVAQAQSGVASARAQVAQAEAQVSQANAGRSFALGELDRYEQLYSQGAISASDVESRRRSSRETTAQVESARSQVTAGRAQVANAEAQVRSAEEQLRAVESQISTAQSRLEQAKVALEGTRLYAPFDGIIAYLNIRENEYYSLQSVSSQLGNYQELLSRVPIVVIDPSEFEVTSELSVSSGERVSPGQTTLLTATEVGSTQGANGLANGLASRAQARGSIYAVNPAVTPGNRSIELTSRITSGAENLQHGQSATLWIAAAEKNDAVVVPLNAVVFRAQVPYAFVVNEETNTIEQRRVELGIEGLDQREILSGVRPGEQLVTEGQNGLVDGAAVRIAQSDFVSSTAGGQ